ncbi:MAG: hypothetical protein LBV48_00645, partial [Mycoplasmataceae bacterium]|nr:hypothetical protein [Mycoplasmataceae bacterium]
QTLTYVSSTYKNFSLRTIPTDLSDDDMQNSVDIDNPADGSSWQTSLKEHYDELVGTTFLNPVTDEYPTFNDFIGQAFKQSAEIGVSPNDHVFRDMLYTDIISSLAVTVATHNSNISIDEIPGFWTDKEFGNQFEQAPVFGSAPFLPDFTNSSYLDWDCRFNDTSLFLENDCNSSIPDKGNIPMMWYPERSSGPGPYSFNAAETNENIIDARQDKVWFASQDDNGVSQPIYADYFITAAPTIQNDDGTLTFESNRDCWIVMRGYDAITKRQKTIYLPSLLLSSQSFDESYVNTDYISSWDSFLYYPNGGDK